MVQWQQLHFEEISDLLQGLGSTGNAAEGHGVLCGLLCSKGYINGQMWVSRMVSRNDQSETEHTPAPDAVPPLPRPLLDLHSETVRGINDINYEFRLMLPDDDEDLEIRVEALTQWCQGFLYGMGVGGIQDFSNLPEPVVEITHDVMEISRASSATTGSEEDETAFSELVEYIRVGIQLIHEELQPVPPNAGPQHKPTLH